MNKLTVSGKASSTTSYMIRSLRAEDMTAVATLLGDTFYPPRGWLGGWVSPLMRLGLYQDLQTRYFARSPSYACLVVVPCQPQSGTGPIVGTVEVAVRPLTAWGLQSPQVPYLSNLAIAPAYRRQGLARQLLLAAEKIVQRWGHDTLYLHVKAQNTAARDLYRQLDYRPRPESTFPWGVLFGQSAQILLCKGLPPLAADIGQALP